MTGRFKPTPVFVALFCALVSGYWIGVRHASATVNAPHRTYELNISLFGNPLHLVLAVGTLGTLVIFTLTILLAVSVALTIEAYRRRRQAEAANRELEIEIKERKRAENEVHELNVSLERRVAERTAELQAANKELEAFSYAVSHDLRAPLRAIDGFSTALLQDCPAKLDGEGRRYLERICAATQRMRQLIDDLLNLSRVTRAEIRREEVDLTALAQEVVTELRRLDPGRNVEVNIGEGLTAHGDRRLIRQVLENLTGNAWKYTSKQPAARIEIAISDNKDSKPVYFVQDNGAGFDMKYADKLFSAFHRLHSATDFPGTGVGLATVQRIIHRHGGEVWAKSTVGQGATFYFTL